MKLQEIKKGQEGTGLLFENDGYLSYNHSSINESSLNSNKFYTGGEWNIPFPFVVDVVFQKYGIKNANGRIYPENILKREVEKYQKRINDRSAYAELNHPEDSTIDGGRIALNVIELHWEKQTLVGKAEIPISYDFWKNGRIGCVADDAASKIYFNRLKLGVSSRGLGSVKNQYGDLIVGDDFELICFDIVTDPSTPNAWIFNSDEEKSMYVENYKPITNSKLSKLDKLITIL
ncbi:MAG: hypothetical protein M0R03_17525 [Novosphingobium sp.]|nr:hypothetical protein [Novosphingobium sp.]